MLLFIKINNSSRSLIKIMLKSLQTEIIISVSMTFNQKSPKSHNNVVDYYFYLIKLIKLIKNILILR